MCMCISCISASSISHFSFTASLMALSENHPPPQPASDSAFPIFAIIVLSILATAFLLITYFTFVTRCCSNWPFRWLSILRAPPNEDPSIAFSPTIWSRGLHESIIREIPTFQFVKRAAQDSDNPGVYGCVVCLTDFQEQEMLRILPNCTHAFHLDCIDVWLQSNANCPLCRSSILGTTPAPIDHIIAPNSSPQFSQLLSNMGSVEDFMVIEVVGEQGEILSQRQLERNDSRECLTESRSHSIRKTEQKPRKCHHVSIMGDECIDVRNKVDQICIQPIRRSFSMDSANDRQVYSDVQAIMQQNRHQNEAGASEECNSRGRKSLFPFHYGRGSKNAVLPLENEV